jgi:hypothetical protein
MREVAVLTECAACLKNQWLLPKFFQLSMALDPASTTRATPTGVAKLTLKDRDLIKRQRDSRATTIFFDFTRR